MLIILTHNDNYNDNYDVHCYFQGDIQYMKFFADPDSALKACNELKEPFEVSQTFCAICIRTRKTLQELVCVCVCACVRTIVFSDYWLISVPTAEVPCSLEFESPLEIRRMFQDF